MYAKLRSSLVNIKNIYESMRKPPLEFTDTCFNMASSCWRMGRVSYSYADAMISISPFNFVLADSDTLNSSKNEINKKMHY